jgi:flagellar hook protein FlgE
MTLDISAKGVSACSKRFGTHALNLASVGAVAGKETGNFITVYNTGNGKGVESIDFRYLNQVGAALPSIEATNFTIHGQGYAPVRDKPEKTGVLGFVRDCTFHADKNKDFVNNLGQYLQVYLTEPDGTPKNPDVTTEDSLTTLNIANIAQSAKATSEVSISMLLNGAAASGDKYPMTIPVYDSFGIVKNLTATWEKVSQTPTLPNGNQVWKLQVKDCNTANPATVAEPYATGITVEFDSKGLPAGYPEGNPTTTPPALVVAWADGAEDSTINLNLGSVGKNDAVVVSGNSFVSNSVSQNGYTAGNFASMEVGNDGFCFLHLTNGQQLKYCRIPLAVFNNVNGLKEREPGVFQRSIDSGAYNFFFPGQNGAGLLEPGTHEGSTVDGTQVYLDMLDTQRVFVGNLKAIEVDKEMNNKLMNI